MLFVVNIGNTNVQYGTFSQDSVRSVRSFSTSELGKRKFLPKNVQVAASTVVPEAIKILEGKNIFWIGPEKKLPVDFSLVDKRTIGADRVVNAVALSERFRLPAIIIDAGTAITIDAVDHRKRFLGGAILPGRMLLRKSLNDRTAQLPLVPLSEKIPAAIGRKTVDAIRSGVDIGAIGSVTEIIKRIRLEMGVKTCKIIAVGGDADFFVGNIRGLEDGGKYFTLLGIAKSWEYVNHEN